MVAENTSNKTKHTLNETRSIKHFTNRNKQQVER